MSRGEELLRDLVDSESWPQLLAEVDAMVRGYQARALAFASTHEEMVESERHKASALALQQLITRIVATVDNIDIEDSIVYDEESLY